jgi:hypothetical protein
MVVIVEQKNGAVVRRLMAYGRCEGVEAARVMTRLHAAARLYDNFFQPSFKLKEKRREGAKVIKRYHAPSTPYERALAHPQVAPAMKQQLREQYRTLDPVVLLAEIRAAQEELGNRIDRRDGKAPVPQRVQSSAPDAIVFARTLGGTVHAGDPRATHRRPKRRYKTKVRVPSKLDPHVAMIENWLAAEPQLTAFAIVSRLSDKYPGQFGKRQHSIVQRLLKSLRNRTAKKLFTPPSATTTAAFSPGTVEGSGCEGPEPSTALSLNQARNLDAARLKRATSAARMAERCRSTRSVTTVRLREG